MDEFLKTLDDAQLDFLTRWLGADPEGMDTNGSKLFFGAYREETTRLFRRPTNGADQALSV